MTGDRPKPIKPIKPNQPNRPIPAADRNNSVNRQSPQKPIAKGDASTRAEQPKDIQGQIPSPWLQEVEPPIAGSDTFVGFAEYLRWMRSPDRSHKDATKVQILQLAAEKSTSYQNRLRELTERTKLMAGKGNTFEAKSSWRIRVGGHRGPESILLPAFDALGIPYLPSSTLRGVARNQAIRELAKEMKYPEAVMEIAPYFGSIDTKNPHDRAGKVIFFDAYPLPSQAELLAVDMANNIWKWENDLPIYNSNPNAFLSLKAATFLIGISKTARCDEATFDRVKGWLIAGLEAGIGSQLNSGYGEMLITDKIRPRSEIIRVKFHLEGQLIHGLQRFTQWNWNDRKQEYQMRGHPVAEVRPIAFKSMLRYWFRALGLGVLSASEVQTLEGKIFGAITPKPQQGWLKFNITERNDGSSQPLGKNDNVPEQSGTLIISYATAEQPQSLKNLIENLTWMMFYLGGVGQGARRPCYYRGDRDHAKPPFYRGSTLFPSGDSFWNLPREVPDFHKRFQQRLRDFHTALAVIMRRNIDPNQLQTAGESSRDTWQEEIDLNCKIIVCSGREDYGKPFALACLHSLELKDRGEYDANLCGTVRGKVVKPSPVWIRDLGEYQVVTVFGADVDPRQKFLKKLRQDSQDYQQIFPLTINVRS
jgi:CRISPR-associated protein Cmr6